VSLISLGKKKLEFHYSSYIVTLLPDSTFLSYEAIQVILLEDYTYNHFNIERSSPAKEKERDNVSMIIDESEFFISFGHRVVHDIILNRVCLPLFIYLIHP